MGLLTSNLSRFRNDPRLFKLPPFLALLCMLGGIIWICLLPLDQYSRRNYISENALLPGQVHTYFTGSEQNIFRAYRHEVADVLEPKEHKDEQGNPTGNWVIATDSHRTDRLQEIFRHAGIKTAKQPYKYESAGKTYSGENLYGIVKGPRADGTESIVLVASIRNIEDRLNVNGVTLLLTLARYFSRWSLWSKDIIIVITPDSTAGPQAWVDAYHSMHNPGRVADLNLKSGHIQGAICIDYPFDHRFETLHIAYDGVNGQLPNLDLINTFVSIASGQMGIDTHIQNQQQFAGNDEKGKYAVRLRTLFRGMQSQALGHTTGPHSVFMPYHIDAITLTAVGNGWQDEMAFGRTIESMTRSLNNLLEKLHQSFFFYLLLQNTRFVSIGTYLPSAMAIGAAFTIIAIFSWVRSGYDEVESQNPTKSVEKSVSESGTVKKSGTGDTPSSLVTSRRLSALPLSSWVPFDRHLHSPLAYLAAIQLLSLLPIYFLTHLQVTYLGTVAITAASVTLATPAVLASTAAFSISQSKDGVASPASLKTQFFTILSSISLLILGLDLTVLATLNFSQSMLLGILCAPLAFVGYINPRANGSKIDALKRVVSVPAIFLFSPPVAIVGLAAFDVYYMRSSMVKQEGVYATLKGYIEAEAFAFNVSGAWGIMVGIWAVWVPAWIVGAMGVIASFGVPESDALPKAKPVITAKSSVPQTADTGAQKRQKNK